MRTRTGRVVAAAALLAAGALAGTGLSMRSAESATPAAGALKTHFGAAAADIVVLHLSGTVAARRFERVRADGSVEADWRAPSGSAFFATDVEWAAGWQNPSQGPYERTLRLQVVNDAMPSLRATVMYAGSLPLESLQTPTKLYGSGAARAQVGFTVAPGAHLEVDAPSSLDADGNPQTGPWLGDVVLRGYLIRAK